ncbi:hypothetical protein [Actinomadura rubrisoli]|uniref:Uncharacterized protein n=1 Tax=Actinomadura rubrisoli TaxID=2530368 RepID=A0A4R5BZK1_9ACTN|nr:hypothetical protein [Actinomadura rubrisoli]TDD91346.1 hypothetical protein E1298_12010 [Actinomadura rubrisoli]
MNGPKSYDGLSALVLFLGVYEGALPLVARLWGGKPLLSVPSHMSGPAWWIVSAAVIVVAFCAASPAPRDAAP